MDLAPKFNLLTRSNRCATGVLLPQQFCTVRELTVLSAPKMYMTLKSTKQQYTEFAKA